MENEIMSEKFIELMLENLDNSALPIHINWEMRDFYVIALKTVIEKTMMDFGIKGV